MITCRLDFDEGEEHASVISVTLKAHDWVELYYYLLEFQDRDYVACAMDTKETVSEVLEHLNQMGKEEDSDLACFYDAVRRKLGIEPWKT